MKNTILIVEDEVSAIKLLENNLKGFSIVSKENGLEALMWLEEGNIPLLIIADLNMPQMNGFEFIVKIKSNRLFSKIPLVIASAEDNVTTKDKCLKAGADNYLIKPINLQELSVTIKGLTDHSKKHPSKAA